MDTDLQLGVAEMFRDATMQNVVLELRTEADWERFNEIKEHAKQQERQEYDNFDNNRSELLKGAVKDLQNQAGSKTFEHPTPFGTDRFDGSELQKQAETKVVNDHKARLLQIKTEESEAYCELKQDIRAREDVRDHARDNFAQAVDRRAGDERRTPTRTR